MKTARNTTLLSVMLVASASSVASAECGRNIPGPNSHLYNALGEPFLITYHPAHQAFYNLREDRGWGESRGDYSPLRSTHEYARHLMGSLLVQFGVVGDPPLVRQVASVPVPIYAYDNETILASRVFHRSQDEWGPLSLAGKFKACTGLNFFTGGPSCAESTDFGHQTVTGVDDEHPSFPGTSAWHHSIWDLFKDPDWEIEYFCKAFDDRILGAVFTAEMIVHENWHATRAPKHVGRMADPQNDVAGGQDFCTQGDAPGRCDTYVTRAPSGRKYAQLAELQDMGVGAYQVQHRFICDLAEGPADWIPLITQKVISERAYVVSRASRFTNLKYGRPPFTCGAPRDALARSPSSCNGGRRCVDSSWCGSTGVCQNGCCVSIPR